MSSESHKPDDRELDTFLAGDSDISREYRRLHRVPAPPALDESVLRLAREAAALSRPVSAVTRWRVPLALAATVLLSVGALRLMQQDTVVQRELTFDDAVPMAAPAPAAVSVESAPPASARSQVQPDESMDRRAPLEKRAARPLPSTPPTVQQSSPAKREVQPTAPTPDASPRAQAESKAREAEAESLQRLEQASSQMEMAMAKRHAFAAAAAPEPAMSRAAPAAAGAMAMERGIDAMPDDADILPACPPPQPESCEADAAARETCFGCVRQLRDRGELESARALMRELRRRAQSRDDAAYAVPDDLKPLDAPP